MNANCFEFRARLAQLLSGGVLSSGGASSGSDERAIGELSWHEHLLGCEECRALLETEQALEQLLASLPRPHLPPELTARVLARLEPHRAADAALDKLLALPTADVPGALATDVLARLAAARLQARESSALERLLERVPAPTAPAELKDRVLTGLRFARERARRTTSRPLTPSASSPSASTTTSAAGRRVSRTRLLALAAGLAVCTGLAALWFAVRTSAKPQELADASARPHEPERPVPVVTTTTPANPRPSDEPSPELLASLDLLESWELVASDDVDVQLNALNTMDELLLSIDADTNASTDPQPDPKPSESSPTKG